MSTTVLKTETAIHSSPLLVLKLKCDRYIFLRRRVLLSCNASFKSSYGLTNGVHIKGGNVRKLFLNLLRHLNYLRSAVGRPPP